MSVATPMHFRVNVNLQTIKTFHIFSVLMTCVVFRIVCVHFKRPLLVDRLISARDQGSVLGDSF